MWLNSLKIQTSERLRAAINQLIQMVSLRYGPCQELPLERMLRNLLL